MATGFDVLADFISVDGSAPASLTTVYTVPLGQRAEIFVLQYTPGVGSPELAFDDHLVFGASFAPRDVNSGIIYNSGYTVVFPVQYLNEGETIKIQSSTYRLRIKEFNKS